MIKLYRKSELWFAIVWIAIYVIVNSFANSLSETIGVESSANAIINIVLTVFLFAWLKKNGLFMKYGLCKTTVPASRFLWYIPLVILASYNLWNGFAINGSWSATACYILSMLCVGFLEEIIFRGFLFKAIAKDNIKSAIIIASVTFGLGHLTNQLNGNSESVISGIIQVIGAISVGFLLVTIVYRGGSLLPCIIVHSALDMVSAFANEAGLTPEKRILLAVIRLAITVAYTLILMKTLPIQQHADC